MKSLTACDKVRLKYDVCQLGADVGRSVRASMEKGIDEREWKDCRNKCVHLPESPPFPSRLPSGTAISQLGSLLSVCGSSHVL